MKDGRSPDTKDAAAAAHPPVPPVPGWVIPPSVFAGVGVFVASDARKALPLAGLAKWVAVRPDLTGGYMDDELRAAGFAVYYWEGLAGNLPVAAWAAPYIAQAESDEQLAAAVKLDPSQPRALIGNLDTLMASDGTWTLLLECYGIDVPADLGSAFPVLGVGFNDGGGAPYTLAQYVPSLAGRKDFSLYLGDGAGVTDEDVATLRRLL